MPEMKGEEIGMRRRMKKEIFGTGLVVGNLKMIEKKKKQKQNSLVGFSLTSLIYEKISTTMK